MLFGVISCVGLGFFKCVRIVWKIFRVSPEIMWMFRFFWNLFRKQWNILGKNEHFEKTRLFLRTNSGYFLTCQVRVVRFYRVVLLLLLLLLHHLCLHFHVHFRLANSSPSSSPTSARSGHCWTSTARVWAHWAPLDLNLEPSELSEHR